MAGEQSMASSVSGDMVYLRPIQTTEKEIKCMSLYIQMNRTEFELEPGFSRLEKSTITDQTTKHIVTLEGHTEITPVVLICRSVTLKLIF